MHDNSFAAEVESVPLARLRFPAAYRREGGYVRPMKNVFVIVFALLSPAALAEAVGVTSGTVSLVQIKAETAEVSATIPGVTGSIDLEAGRGTLTIPVAAWDSRLKVRNKNVRTAFFQAVEHPTATFELESLVLTDGVGKAKGTLKMHSGSVPVEADVKVSTDDQGLTQVVTTAPFSVSISGLGLAKQLEALIKLCRHPSVSDSVKVSISLTLAKE